MTKHHYVRTVFLVGLLAFCGAASAQTSSGQAAAPGAPPTQAAGPATPAKLPVTAAPAVAAQTGSASSAPASLFPTDLSPWGMFVDASVVVKIVITGLAVASVMTWTIWLAKTLELLNARRGLVAALQLLRSAASLGDAARHLVGGKDIPAQLVQAAQDEMVSSMEMPDDRDGVKERIALHLERIEAAAGRRITVGTGILATIGSTAPFVGLFGTVWGIMNSFIGISKAHTSNLAVVAPGIAEALLATALGLVAAIPAVVIYNHFARRIGAYKALIADAAAAALRLASRDLSRQAARRAAPGGTPVGHPPGSTNLRVVME